MVSNADSVRTHRELLNGSAPRAARRFEKRAHYEPACSGVVLYLGLDRAYDHLAHHDFVFSRDPKEEFDFIYNKGEPAPDPTCYLASTARTEPETAPPGGEALYVLVHTPYLRPHHDWKRMLPEYRRVILNTLKTAGQMPDIESRIVCESALTPQDIHDRYRVLNGAIYGLASHGKWRGAFKPANRSPDVKGLYLAGGAAHPGPGMPMVLMSGWIAADSLDQDADCARRAASPQPRTPHDHVHSTVDRLAGRSSCRAGGTGCSAASAGTARATFASTSTPCGCRTAAARSRPPTNPVLIVLNHPSWWDPMIGLVLSRTFADRDQYAAIDAVAVKRYGFFKKLGFVGVDTKSLRGAAEFLRTGKSILSRTEPRVLGDGAGPLHRCAANGR